MLTGAGACGAMLTLEDGIPTRPPGSCNVNQMFKLNTEQAASVEVLRGPGNYLYANDGGFRTDTGYRRTWIRIPAAMTCGLTCAIPTCVSCSIRYFPGRGRELFVELRYSGGAG